MNCAARLAIFLAPLLLSSAPPRFARMGDFTGDVEVQVHAADPWQPALRNIPLIETSWIRSGADARVEIELDEGSALRLAGDSLAELSDYSRLSTGQRITLVSLDHGVAYFSGEPARHDVLTLAVPGAQATLRRGSRLRLEASDGESRIAVLEGFVRFSTATAEMDLREGQLVRLARGASGRFVLEREIPPLDSDLWSEDRDKALANPVSARYAPHVRYGAADLDRSGVWLTTEDYGPVWKPKMPAGWVPFREGKWQWYDELGYTWLANESWGWMPYHHGRWLLDASLGWVWSPGQSAVFKPGEVYWMRGNNLAGWGPLALDENWTGSGPPRLYAAANTTFAKFLPGLREIDPETLAARPKDVLAAASFALALPSPAMVAARLDAVRPALRAGSTRIAPFAPFIAGETYEPLAETERPKPAKPAAVVVEEQPVASRPPVARAEETAVYVAQPELDSYYPVPVYTGIVILNPPERKPKKKSKHPDADDVKGK